MWTTTFVLTFLFFLIQLGTGFSILAIASPKLVQMCRLTKAQFVVLGFTVGASATGILFGLLSLFARDIWLQFAAMVAIACFGLAWSWPNWRPGAGEARAAATWCILSLPIALLTWWLFFGAYSSFPYADIGADVHWMKTAQEYADSGVINPYAAQSYVDLRSAVAGALAGTLGLDLLKFTWTYRFFSILFFLLASYAFVQGIYSASPRKWIAFFFAATGNTFALITNGSLAVASSVVFLGVLMSNADRKASGLSTRPALLLTVSAGATLLVAFAVNNNTFMLALLMAALLLSRILTKSGGNAGLLFLGCVWPAVLLLAHRGSYLFIPTVLVSWLLYLATVRMISAWPSPGIAFLRLLSFGLPLIIAGIVICVAGMRVGYIPPLSANDTFSAITGLILGQRIEGGGELFLGAGPQVATIELGRAMGPLFAICIVLGVAWWWMTRPVLRVPSGAIGTQTEGFAILVWSWIAGCGLSLAVLCGFPFLYRTNAIILSLFTITATEIFCQLLADPGSSSRYRRALVAAVVTLLATILVAAAYAFAWRSDLPLAGYPAFLRPTEIAVVVLLMVTALLTLARSRLVYICGLAGVLGLGVAVDRAGLSGVIRSYSYGALPDSAAVVSHYNADEIEVARWLHGNLRKGIILSDPYTLGMIQALTGAPGAYLFSNLDTVNEAVAKQAKSVVRAVLQPVEGPQRLANACRLIAPLFQERNSETFFQMRRIDALGGIMRTVRDEKPSMQKSAETPSNATVPASQEAANEQAKSTIRGILGSDENAWDLVAIITPRTISWTHLAADQRVSYFPPAEPMDPAIVDELRASPFPVPFANSRTVVVRIPCSR
ncbi:hypothetical protein [Bradyrhizobium diazoefficiens]|uniref:Blr5987 protein n=2 Tax=Bradyrhizobium diazoefficiens TaxID=1355477 RepID=Q89HK3_BRADU|nr:hypothetical protein [Bradyrhizobium diazoefficiens]AND91125.1 hypothetical protein AAV28_27465 [Bradyrhizobium diazoefficiens USDA 110]QBP24750.1 hypothetical protein Bdiaspc4_31580 [Bradyrhizobium diazoefficiens]QLD42278.1 hypothetical protein HUW42_15340 [Bradyrhizobium diazoefficiens]WLB36157.1 hypothetical protein QIH78_32455 [Bradyrhizobium diazoefficiens]WLC18841.1 hypothetical protein QIH76_11170 [Bradyrhizobium diazoefficiens]